MTDTELSEDIIRLIRLLGSVRSSLAYAAPEAQDMHWRRLQEDLISTIEHATTEPLYQVWEVRPNESISVLVRGITNLEDACVIAYHESRGGQDEVYVSVESIVTPIDLDKYAGNDAKHLRDKWHKAGRPIPNKLKIP